MNKLAKNSVIHPQEIAVPLPIEVHPSVSAKAAELLLKTADAICSDPDRYDQGICNTHLCGSPLCIYGHMAYFSGLKILGLPDESAVEARATEVGLTGSQLTALFYTENWPTPHGHFMHEATPAQGIARIEHFLTTGQ